jgi:hypothetical protein
LRVSPGIALVEKGRAGDSGQKAEKGGLSGVKNLRKI